MIVIDGEQFKIDVLSVKRSADFLDKYAERLANGHLRRELIGVYFNYKLQFGPGLDRKEWPRADQVQLWLLRHDTRRRKDMARRHGHRGRRQRHYPHAVL